jgi:hypothetical protein
MTTQKTFAKKWRMLSLPTADKAPRMTETVGSEQWDPDESSRRRSTGMTEMAYAGRRAQQRPQDIIVSAAIAVLAVVVLGCTALVAVPLWTALAGW